jgi:uncharacterized repeat protein (TIGR03847 family)
VIEIDLQAPHHVTVGYVGEPGRRTFHLQAEDVEQRVSLTLEKQQVEGLGELLAQLLARVDDAPATDWDRAAMALREPVEPVWRIGEISLGLDPDAERFVLEFAEFLPDLEDLDLDAVDPREVRVHLDRDQARRLAAHALEIVGEGRPRCQLCGRPTSLDGSHVCPSTNGHGRLPH